MPTLEVSRIRCNASVTLLPSSPVALAAGGSDGLSPLTAGSGRICVASASVTVDACRLGRCWAAQVTIDDLAVWLNGALCSEPTWESSTTLSCVIPPADGVDIPVVVLLAGLFNVSGVLPAVFAPPALASAPVDLALMMPPANTGAILINITLLSVMGQRLHTLTGYAAARSNACVGWDATLAANATVVCVVVPQLPGAHVLPGGAGDAGGVPRGERVPGGHDGGDAGGARRSGLAGVPRHHVLQHVGADGAHGCVRGGVHVCVGRQHEHADGRRDGRAVRGGCVVGAWCPAGSAAPTARPPGTFSNAVGARRRHQRARHARRGGYAQLRHPQTSARLCGPGVVAPATTYPAGYFCVTGSITPTACAAGNWQPAAGNDTGLQCPSGVYCGSAATAPMACPPGYYCPASYVCAANATTGTATARRRARWAPSAPRGVPPLHARLLLPHAWAPTGLCGPYHCCLLGAVTPRPAGGNTGGKRAAGYICEYGATGPIPTPGVGG